MRSTAAARRYAAALFQLARDEHRVSEVGQELDVIASAFEDSQELRSALLTPLHPAAERKAVLRALCTYASLGPLVANFYSFLIDRRRLLDFDAIRDEYQRLANQASGLVTAQVVSATPLDDRRQDRLRRALSERTGFEVRLDVRIDPELIGGAVAKVGDMVFDGSLRSQLDQLRASLSAAR